MDKTDYQAEKTTDCQLKELVDKFFADDEKEGKKIKEKLMKEKEKYGDSPLHVTTRLVDREYHWTTPNWQDQLRKIERNGERRRRKLYRVERTTF